MKTPGRGKAAEAWGLTRMIRNILDLYENTQELSLPETWDVPSKCEEAFINTFLKWQGKYTDQGVVSAIRSYFNELKRYKPKRGRGFPRLDAIVIDKKYERQAKKSSGRPSAASEKRTEWFVSYLPHIEALTYGDLKREVMAKFRSKKFALSKKRSEVEAARLIERYSHEIDAKLAENKLKDKTA